MKKWTSNDDKQPIECNGRFTITMLSRNIKHSPYSVKQRIHFLRKTGHNILTAGSIGCGRSNWTLDEDNIIHKLASSETPENLYEALPSHTPSAIDLRCLRLGIVRKYKSNFGAKGKESPLYTGYERLDGRRMFSYKNNANRRNLEFSVTPQYLWELLEKQKFRCVLSNLPIDISKNKVTASPDRIDSCRGYVEGNIQWVHKDINFLKQNCSQERFIELCCAVANNIKIN